MISVGLFAAVKVLVAIGIVVALSLVAEHVGPRVAGILSGYPLGAALSLLFIGIEIDPGFAAESAMFTAAGLSATMAFASGYYLGLGWSRNMPRKVAVPFCILLSVSVYFLAAWLLSNIPLSWLEAPIIAISTIGLAGWWVRRTPDVRISGKVRFGLAVTLLRAGFAALVILLITTAAKIVGPGWTGLFSAFPVTMLPLLVIIQTTYEPAHVRTIIKNVPRGLCSLLLYVSVIAAAYPTVGLLWGTILGYLAATGFLAVLEFTGFGKKPAR